MRRVERTAPAPASLSGPAANAEAAAAEAYYATWEPGDTAFSFKQYKAYDVVHALRTLFHGKCAYCEGPIERGTAEVEHYRPKGRVEEAADHPGYWWLAHTWTNLVPSCGPCNKAIRQHIVTPTMTVADVERLQSRPPRDVAGKAEQFPIAGTRLVAKEDDHEGEQSMIVDPTRCNPDEALEWRADVPFSVVVPRQANGVASPKGSHTIRCLGLNRVGLVEARTKVLNVLRTLRTQIIQDLEEATQDPASLPTRVADARARVDALAVYCEPDQPYSAMADAFVEALRQEVRDWIEARAVHPAI